MKINKLKAINFKRFDSIEIDFKQNINVIVGDNESGKSSILLAIDLVLSGSINKIETLGLDSLFNTDAIKKFFTTKTYETLPKLIIELYFDDIGDEEFFGRNNSLEKDHFGISLICFPREDLSKDISDILRQDTNNFPYEYYSISFIKFKGNPYWGFKKQFKHILLDNTVINNEYATNSYVRKLYNFHVSKVEKNKHLNEYRNFKLKFKESVLKCLNDRVSESKYEFSIKNNTKSNLETDLTITEDNVDLQNRGKGKQCLIKTEFALQKNENELDIIMLEEPENHLSHINMLNLIERLNKSQNKQLFITTHNSLISSRLDLRNSILLNSSSKKPIVLKELSEETAKFFVKSPYNNILEFILSSRVILVEGDTEYILLEKFFELETKKKPNLLNIHIISVGGKRFKRYMEVANLLKIKTAVITDNDKDYQNKCVDNYASYNSENVKVFYETDNDIYTFEISLYNNNKEICDEIFSGKFKKNKDVKQYMLDNKTKCALELLDKKGDELTVPEYIKESIEWLREN